MSLVVLAVIAIIVNVIQFLFLDDLYTKNAKKNMIYYAEQIENLDFESKSFMKNISEIEAQYNIYVELYSPREKLIYTSNTNSWIYDSDATTDFETLKPRIMKILSHDDIDSESYFETRQEYFATAKYIVYNRTEGENAIEIYYSADLIAESSKDASIVLLGLSIVFLFFAVAVVLGYVAIFSLPLRKINNITNKLAKMDFSETCPGFRITELDELSRNINALSASLELTLRDLKAKNLKLQADIQKEHQLEETRKQFIANASHELKTPIAIIQSYAEGLKYGITGGKDEEYCDTIIDEATKMNNLVIKLLEIFKHEHDNFSANFTHFNILEFLNKCLGSMSFQFEQNGITLKLDVDPLYKGYGDTDLLIFVFENYVSNAVFHCEGEKIISVTCTELDAAYRVSVFNTGKQIDKNDIGHLWESFYRADKAHSRANGRFGLGLSIVASFQNIHKQKYGVVNRKDGVEFWFDISKYEIQS